jgi:hypothetical protein
MFSRGIDNLAWLEALTPKSSIITDGLGGNFDPEEHDSSSTTWENNITDGGNLYIGNGLELITGADGTYFQFDGTDDFIGNLAETGYSAAVGYNVDLTANNLTFSFWWWASAVSAGEFNRILSIGNVAYTGTGHHGLSMSMDDASDKLSFQTFNDAYGFSVTRTTTDDIGRNMWNHITVVKEGSTSTLRIYVNGKYQQMSITNEGAAYTDTESFGGPAQPIQFGRIKAPGPTPWRYTAGACRIGMILLYNTKALKKSEIMSNYLAKKADYGH